MLKVQHYIPTRPVPAAASADFYHHQHHPYPFGSVFGFECRRQLIVPDDGKAPHSAHP